MACKADVLRLLKAGKTTGEIATALNCLPEYVRASARRNRMALPPALRFNDGLPADEWARALLSRVSAERRAALRTQLAALS